MAGEDFSKMDRDSFFQYMLQCHYVEEPLRPEILQVVEDYLKSKNLWFRDPQLLYDPDEMYEDAPFINENVEMSSSDEME